MGVRDGWSGCSGQEFDDEVYSTVVYVDGGCSDIEDQGGIGNEAGY